MTASTETLTSSMLMLYLINKSSAAEIFAIDLNSRRQEFIGFSDTITLVLCVLLVLIR
jgi:hypothetical protein